MPGTGREDDFEQFVRDAEPRLRRALVATYGTDRGREATSEAMAYAWEHWTEVAAMANPVGYLFRVGQSRTRPRRAVVLKVAPSGEGSNYEPGLIGALESLSEQQRQAVLLVHGHGWTLQEVADLLGVSKGTVQTHLGRGMAKVQRCMGVDDDDAVDRPDPVAGERR